MRTALIRAGIAAVALSVCAAQAQTPHWVCTADLNDDGAIDAPGEMADCTSVTATAADAGSYTCPLQSQACSGDAATGYACPLGAQYACLGAPGTPPRCSVHACVDANANNATVTPPVNDPTPTSSAPLDASGQCTGVVHIFPGRASSCKGQGVETFFKDCCESPVSQTDTMGAPGGPSQAQRNQSSSALAELLNFQCSAGDADTAEQRASGYCVAIGDTCAESWPAAGCVQTVHAYCCFNSLLARIIQQQGRAQIPSMGGFGTPDAPHCDGFTPAQFQSIDFSKIDFSAYYAELQYDTQAQVQAQVTTRGLGH
jgi:conjugal transfer mating pair stabilization protein TraN